MVISFEEKDRARIEATGMTIIEFKRNLYKVSDWVVKLWEATKKVAEAIIEAFNKAFADPIKELSEKLKEAFEDISDWYKNLPEAERHKIVKYYAKANNPSTVPKKNTVYRCRNNC